MTSVGENNKEEPLFDLIRDIPTFYNFHFDFMNSSMSSNLTSFMKDEIQIQNKTIKLKFYGFGEGKNNKKKNLF